MEASGTQEVNRLWKKREQRLVDSSRPIFEYRPLPVRLVAAIAAFVLSLISAGIAGAALPAPVGDLAALAVLVMSPVVAWRGMRISIIADKQTIVIRNYFTTHTLRWEEVSDIAIGIHHFFAQLPAVAFRRRGENLWITAQASGAGEAECKKVIRALAGLRTDLPIRFAA